MQIGNRIDCKRQDEPQSFTVEIDLDHRGLTVKPKQVAQRVQNGQEAWSRLRNCQAWADWLLVAEALDVGRTEAMQAAHTNKPEGRRYNEEYGGWLEANRFDRVNKTTRSQLFKCLIHRNEIEAWRATLIITERLKLNHPVAVLRRWENNLVKKPDDAAPKVSQVEKLKASIAALSEENERYKREIDRGGGELWSPLDTAKDIAAVIVAKVSASKAQAIAQELARLARARLMPQATNEVDA